MNVRLAAFAVATCFALTARAQQTDFSKVEIKTIHVAGNAYTRASRPYRGLGVSKSIVNVVGTIRTALSRVKRGRRWYEST